MNLAEHCESIWPCGWIAACGKSTAYAFVLGHKVSVQTTTTGGFNACLKNVCTVSASLRGALERLHKQLTSLPPIPDLMVVPVHKQAEEVLQAQGWERSLQGFWSKPFLLAVLPERTELWYSGSCVRSITLEQGTVHEQLRELLTFPQWKET